MLFGHLLSYVYVAAALDLTSGGIAVCVTSVTLSFIRTCYVSVVQLELTIHVLMSQFVDVKTVST